MADSSIEWTDFTWNFVTGCDKVSQGCKHCYAETLSRRLQAMGAPKYSDGFRLSIHEEALHLPLSWRKPRRIFVNSMSDLFHEAVPEEIIQRGLEVMRQAYWHRFQILTKRSERFLELDRRLDWPENVWMGVSVENQDHVDRIEDLRLTGAFIKFLSLEPLLGPLTNLNLSGIDWVIVGGESGPKARPMDADWVTDLRDQCLEQGVPFFFKQWGGKNKKKSGRLLEGRTWDQMPSTPVMAVGGQV